MVLTFTITFAYSGYGQGLPDLTGTIDPVCVYCGNGEVERDEQCEYPLENDNEYCNQTTETCNGTIHGRRDEYGFCDAECGCIPDPFVYRCNRFKCNAECDEFENCLNSTCSERYDDYCTGMVLNEYDNDKKLDFTVVQNDCQNQCHDSCMCTNCTPVCLPPETNSYCSYEYCGAECDFDNTCENMCVGDVLFFNGTCRENCTCSYETFNCISLDGWYESGNTRMISTGECTGKEQMEMEYHIFNCLQDAGCSYAINSTKWIDTNTTMNSPDGTACNDGYFCTTNDRCLAGACSGSPFDCDDGFECTIEMCNETADICEHAPNNTACDDGRYCNGEETCAIGIGCQNGTSIDCSGSNIDSIETCLYAPEGNPFTWDYFIGFTSFCIEETDSCSTGVANVTSNCDIDQCNASCVVPGDCPEKCTLESHKLYTIAECNNCECGYSGYQCVVGRCGAECSDDSECPCPKDICVEDILFDYPDHGFCGTAGSTGCLCQDNSGIEGQSKVSLVPGAPECIICIPEDEVCDGLDNDCDKIIDEGGDALCNDGLWCNGAETCQGFGGCVNSTPVDCSDSVNCTVDSCNEATDSCENVGNNSYCDDGRYCNGQETCNPWIGCRPGAPVDCSNHSLDPIGDCFWDPDNNPLTWDLFPGFESWCDEGEDICVDGEINYSHECSVDNCNAACDNGNPCPDSECSETYYDYCNGTKLVEYDDNGKMDSTTVNDSAANDCLDDCTCTNMHVDCSSPETIQHCVVGACGAQCADISDCNSTLINDACQYPTACGSCECAYEEEWCFEPGTIDNGTCYYGLRECNADGCSIDQCELNGLGLGICDPDYGCIECVDLGTIVDQFHDGLTQRMLAFQSKNSTNTDAKISFNFSDLIILSATLDATGQPLNMTVEGRVDTVLVEDISGSMDDDCGTDGMAQPGEAPCKINDKKAADANFVNTLLDNGGAESLIALVAYSTDIVDSLSLSNNKTLLLEHIDAYKAGGTTCISCGIDEGIQLLKAGTSNNRIMVLMSDAKANACMNGICTLDKAMQEALDKAEEAWQVYGIIVHAIAYGADADITTMQNIANLGNGNYYYADNYNISEIYGQIAEEVLFSYPYKPRMDVGSNGMAEWAYPGIFNETDSIDFTQELKELIANCTCPGCSMLSGECVIDLGVFSENEGRMLLDNLNITACSYQELKICVDDDEDGYFAYDEIFCPGGDDCNDMSAGIHPGATETCNQKDDDCDGQTDEGNVCGLGGNGGNGGSGPTGGDVCTPMWNCTEWSECQDNEIQVRECVDLNDCGTDDGKPAKEKACDSQELSNICTAGIRLCANSHVMECVNGTGWEIIEDCEHGCDTDINECKPGTDTILMETGDGLLASSNGITGLLASNREAMYGILVVLIIILAAVGYWKYIKK